MKVLTAELVASNRRERVSGGVYIEFETTENVKKDDYFKVRVGDNNYDFQANGIKVIGESLKITANEVGYWASKLDHKGIDLREVIGCDITPVTDDTEKSKIRERSCWC
jgi:hypothetical protein